MKKYPVEIVVDDNDGELKIIGLTIDNVEFWGHEPYQDKPGVINMEFLFEGIEDEVETQQMKLLEDILNKNNIPFVKVNPNEGEDLDNDLIYIQINKDYLDITWDEEEDL